MAITAIQIESSNSLEQFRQEFNNLQSDVSGLEAGTISFAAITTTSSNTTTLNVKEDGTIVFEDIVVISLKVNEPASKPETSDCKLLNSCLNCSRLFEDCICIAVIAINFYPIRFLTYL